LRKEIPVSRSEIGGKPDCTFSSALEVQLFAEGFSSALKKEEAHITFQPSNNKAFR
jgi:hypothetical protein